MTGASSLLGYRKAAAYPAAGFLTGGADQQSNAPLPRLLVIDMTPIGRCNATGELKASYLRNWPAGRLLHVCRAGDGIGVSHADGRLERVSVDEALKAVLRFGPECMLYRPVDTAPALDALFDAVRGRRGTPFALWLMDDWMERLRLEDARAHAHWAERMTMLTGEAQACFAISEGMAEAFEDRYGSPFHILRNGVDPQDWPDPAPRAGSGAPLIRYAGAIAPHHSRNSVLRIAQAIETLGDGSNARFEIKTQPVWRDREASRFASLSATTITVADMTPEEYRSWLAEADIVVAAYDFDEAARTYLRYSFANKTPEILASGAVPFIHGPADIETVKFLRRHGVGVIADSEDMPSLRRALRHLIRDPQERAARVQEARGFAFGSLNLAGQRTEFEGRMRSMADIDEDGAIGSALDQESRVSLHEWDMLADILEGSAATETMVDVGAHYGGSLKPFAKAGWSVLAFEPDPANRQKLEQGFGANPGIEIVAAAVGPENREEIPIFASDESTGISGLSAFRDSHHEVARVPLVTLDTALAARDMAKVGFLKIDVEGHEMGVLQGLDFDKVRPDVVMVEYEDSKTLPQGYDTHDLARTLLEAGYTVYVSEWWPIERYGTAHSWRRLRRYPYEVSPAGWGNLIGFLNDPGENRLAEALRKVLRPPKPASPAPAASAPVPALPADDLTAAGAEGRKLVILGGGIQAEHLDPSMFQGFDVLCVNHPPERWAAQNAWPDYFLCLNARVAARNTEQIDRLIGLAQQGEVKRLVLPDSVAADVRDRLGPARLLSASELSQRLPGAMQPSGDARADALLWARAMGYRDIYLAGVDRAYPAQSGDAIEQAFTQISPALRQDACIINLDWASELPQFSYGDVKALAQDAPMALTPPETAAEMLRNERSSTLVPDTTPGSLVQATLDQFSGAKACPLFRVGQSGSGANAGGNGAGGASPADIGVDQLAGILPALNGAAGAGFVVDGELDPPLHAFLPDIALRFEIVASLKATDQGGVEMIRWPHRQGEIGAVIGLNGWNALVSAVRGPA